MLAETVHVKRFSEAACPTGSFPSARGLNHAAAVRVLLHRKEVIQPQVPLRLPCYDFAPVTGFTFGTSLPCGLGQRLRVPSASMA